MTTRAQIKAMIFRLLLKLDGTPATDAQITGAVQLLIQPAPTAADVSAALRELESEGCITGATDEIYRVTTWSLTTRGEHKARQL